VTVGQELLRALETKEWGMPLALGAVVQDAVNKKEMIPVKEFVDSEESVYAKKGWGVRIPGVGEVVGWGLRQLGLIGEGGDKLINGKFVVLENLEEAGRVVERRVQDGVKGRVERIYSKSLFQETYQDVLGKEHTLSENDLGLLLKFLQRDKSLLSFDGSTIKFKAPGEKSATPITMEDTTIASLKTFIKDLDLQTTVLTKRVDELSLTAKEAVTRKNRVSALAALRSKKLAETTLSKCHATLAQLEEVFSKIEQAADQVELVLVMEGSTKALQGLNKEVGGVERVDDVVDQLRKEMERVDEMGNVIAEPGREAGALDEGEVDDEFEAMEREEREKVEAKERAEKEEREKREAEETRKKLDALNEAERQAAQTKEAAQKQAEQESTAEKEIDEEFKRMSLDTTPEHVPSYG
jgi:charged multivesicular body protein 7